MFLISLVLAGQSLTLEQRYAAAESRYNKSLEVPFATVMNGRSSEEFHGIGLAAGNNPIGIRAWTMALLSSVGDQLIEKRALASLTTTYVKYPELEFFAKKLPFILPAQQRAVANGKIAKVADLIREKSPHLLVKNWALLAKGVALPDISPYKMDVFQRLVTGYPGTPPAIEARKYILEWKNLREGWIFPDFLAVDSKNQKFQLDDYKGKVVVLEFWGDWCPACQRHIPPFLEVVKKYASDKVAFVGVNSDGDGSIVRKLEEKYAMTFRNLVDGSIMGPIATRYNIRGWPTVFVLDGNRKIRYMSTGINEGGLSKGIEEALGG